MALRRALIVRGAPEFERRHRAPRSRSSRPEQIEGHVFYLAFGYSISHPPYAILAGALSGGIAPGFDRPLGALVLLPATALGRECNAEL
jgi:hypothetical protein